MPEPIPKELLDRLNPALRDERIARMAEALQASSGYALSGERLRQKAESSADFVTGVTRHLIQMRKLDGTYDPDTVVPGEVIETEGEA